MTTQALRPKNPNAKKTSTKTPNPALWTQLNAIFEQDIPATAQLLELLETERKALEARNYEGYQELVTNKQTLLAQLEQHSIIRQKLLYQAGFKSEASTLSVADQQAPKVAKAWRALGKQWIHCQQLNEVNELISNRSRLVTGKILDLLRGQTNQQKLYDDKGNAQNATSGRSITSA